MYTFIQVRFLDAILSQNNTDDHMQEFIKQGGLEPMIKLLAITPLAAELTYASANTAIIDTCKNIMVGFAVNIKKCPFYVLLSDFFSCLFCFFQWCILGVGGGRGEPV